MAPVEEQATDINTDPTCSMTADPDIALGSSLYPDVTMDPVDGRGPSDQNLATQATEKAREVSLATFGDVGCAFSHTSGYFRTGKIRFGHKRSSLLENVKYLATALNTGNYDFVMTFLDVYPAFATTWQVLELIMKTYGSLQSDSMKDQNTKIAIEFFLGLMMKTVPQDFKKNPDWVVLNKFLIYLRLHMPFSNLHLHVQKLISQLEEQESQEIHEEDEEARDCEIIKAPEQDTSGMQETLHLSPASGAEPQGDLKTQEDIDVVDPAAGEPTESEAEPAQLLNVDQPLPTPADSLDAAARVPHVKLLFPVSVVGLAPPVKCSSRRVIGLVLWHSIITGPARKLLLDIPLLPPVMEMLQLLFHRTSPFMHSSRSEME
ncbi:uncharacterized protein LOC121464660 [Microtus oregoni]|uniref:uncharacterized protein LOC121464660 n=1 Tax=Microtus oregoni TaxID=111838 RepID=UPI001BB17126|nr:uncharacterized protein LOC121464660 [Microtus oregoni]